MPMPRISEDEGAEREEVLEVELDEEEDATSDSAAPQIPEVLEPIDVVLSMKMEFETLVDNVHGKIAELQKVIQAGPIAPEIRRTRGLKSMGSKEALDLAKEPEVLVKRRQVKAKKGDEKKEKMRLMSRRYGASVGGRDGSNDIRLHGRWMELSTQFAAQGNLEARPARAAVRAHRNSTLELLEEAGAGIPLWHPSGYFRLMWDGFSVLITLLDAFTMPVSLAWEADVGSPDGRWPSGDSGADTLYAIFWTTFFFWSIDIPITCNTAVYINGEIKKNRCMVLWTYLRTWFLFDASLVTLDILTLVALSPDSEMRFLRQFRILRALRLLRLLKMSKFNILLQEVAASTGRQWLILVMAIANTSGLILVVLHLLTCGWFFLGRTLEEDGRISWVTMSNASDIAGWKQYLHSVRFIINSPSPPLIAASSGTEYMIDIIIYVFCLVVLGSAISKISGTMAELRAMNEEHSRQRREIRVYLTNQKASFELVSRIMKFVDYKLEKMAMTNFDASLISTTLQTELYVGQRSRFLNPLPIFAMTAEAFPEVFAGACAALKKEIYETGEAIFAPGGFSVAVHITTTGIYKFTDYDASMKTVEGIQWFEELSLYAEVLLHRTSLSAKTFAELFTLAGNDLAECIRRSPGCTRMFCEYAKEFVAAMQKTSGEMDHEEQVELAIKCCKQNHVYQVLYPDPAMLLENIQIFEEDDEEDLLNYSDSMDDTDRNDSEQPVSKQSSTSTTRLSGRLPSFGMSGSPSPGSKQQSLADDQDDDPKMKDRLSGADLLQQPAPPRRGVSNISLKAMRPISKNGLQTLADDLRKFLANLDTKEVEAEEVPEMLRKYIPELNPETGTHVVFKQQGERERGESSCISILALVTGSYEMFTMPQNPTNRLRREQWYQLRDIIRWIQPTQDQLHAVLILLSIRALGKSKELVNQLPKDKRRPERAVLHIIEHHKNVVPSADSLGVDGLRGVKKALMVHETFNLAQMLQGENVPGNVSQLQDLVLSYGSEGEEVFHFYILFLLGFMSGLAAGQGSRFMNAVNAPAVISGVGMLQHLLHATPRGIYWGFISARAAALLLPQQTAEDLVLMRLACLSRVQDVKSYKDLRRAWDSLGAREQTILVDHFLCDGLEDRALVLEFLPACVANAKSNSLVGLTILLEVLVDLLSNLWPTISTMPAFEATQMIAVDLSDMSEFIAAVQNRFVFQTCVSRCKYHFSGDRVRVEMTGGNWGRTNDPDTDMTSLAYIVKDVLMKQQVMEAYIMRNNS
ncbi:Potassium/sodium hyperpolarization-activated cyclic nucleotide-gated channel 2 [Durusdinium trenchii]|uniref:Potassium/sodium hyperpolarization-activated cyclic nucleotide-gated channel 2 n=1 Tax=Durusdinium trenchii TaxID=1381693 RepID=A0ABP0PS16_9DINO